MVAKIIAFVILIIVLLAAGARREKSELQVIKDLAEFDGRLTGTPGNHAAYLYLLGKIRALKPDELPWAPGFTHEFYTDNQHIRNIVFQRKGLASKTLLIMAHYDHIGPGYPGCNDNASGVYGLLRIAESILRTAIRPHYNVVFALTDCEEYWRVGSAAIAEIIRPDVVVNLDTIGGYPKGSPIFVANDGNFSEYFRRVAAEKNINIKLVGITPGRSDITHFINTTKCVEFGYMLGEYHTTTDTYENLNLENLIVLVDLAIGLVNHIAFDRD
jgi:putative aminopeptidase FrvX